MPRPATCAPNPGGGRFAAAALLFQISLEEFGETRREGCTIGRVRKLLKWIVVTIGIAALVRWFRRRGAESETETDFGAPYQPAADDPADELRRKLAETREADEPEEAPEMPDSTVEERRADVHEQGRATLDEMKPSDES